MDIPSNLGVIEDTLRAIATSQGINQFKLVEDIQGLSKLGQYGKMEGSIIEATSTLRHSENRASITLNVYSPIHKIESNFYLEKDQTLVLGKMGLVPGKAHSDKRIFARLGDFTSRNGTGPKSACSISLNLKY